MKTEFEKFYINWYSRAKSFAKDYVIIETEAEDIVQEVFLHIYERQNQIDNLSQSAAYLFTSIKNRCLDSLQRKIRERHAIDKMRDDIALYRIKNDALENLNTEAFGSEGIDEMVDEVLEQLPTRCREIFIMNKIHGKKQKEIAQELNITINTVESQMAIAYKKIREGLLKCMHNT